MADHLDSVLKQRQLLSAEQVERALVLQQQRGGGLDTVVMEEGWLPEALVLEALGEATGLPPIQLTEYEPNPELTQAVSREVSLLLDLIPLSIDQQNFHIACARALSPESQGEMEMLLGRPLKVWVAPEVRIRDWQFSLYGAQPEGRFLRLLNKLNFEDIGDDDNEATVSASPLQMASDLAKSVVAREPDTGAQETKVITLNAPQILLQSTGSRDELLGTLLRLGLEAFEFVALFEIQDESAVGWRAQSARSSAFPLNHVVIPLQVPSFFATARKSRQRLLGPIPPDDANEAFLQQIGRIPPQVFLHPIEIRSKVQLFFYGDCGDRLIEPEGLQKFLAVCGALPEALERLLKPDFDATVGRLLTADSTAQGEALEELLADPEPATLALIGRFPGPTPSRPLPLDRIPSVEELGPIAAALIQIGPAAAREIALLLMSDKPQIRYLAFLTAGYLPYQDILAGIAAGMLDMHPAVSSAARAAAFALQNHLVIDPVIQHLRDQLDNPDVIVQALAIQGLGALSDVGAIEDLVQRVQSSDRLIAEVADRALQNITKARHSAYPLWSPWWEINRRVPQVEWLRQGLHSQDIEIQTSSREELEWQGR